MINKSSVTSSFDQIDWSPLNWMRMSPILWDDVIVAMVVVVSFVAVAVVAD